MALIIEIQDYSMQVISATANKDGRYQVYNNFNIIFRDDNKEDIEDFSVLLKQKFKEHNIREHRAHIVFNNQKTLSKELVIPKIDRKKMNLLVKHEMQNTLNLGDDYIYDYQTLGTVDKDGVTCERILSYAIRERHIKETEQWLSSVGIKIISIQTSISTIVNLLDFCDILQNNKPLIITDMQKGYSRFYLYSKQELLMIRTVQPDIKDLRTPFDRFINLSKLLINAIQKDYDLVVDRILLLGDYDMLSHLSEDHQKQVDIPLELVKLERAFVKYENSNYITMSCIGALS